MLALVFPGKVMPLPHISPAVASGVLAYTALKTIVLTCRIGLGRRALTKQPAQIDEVFLGRGAFFQLRRTPLNDEFARRHDLTNTCPQPHHSRTFGKGITLRNSALAPFPQ